MSKGHQDVGAVIWRIPLFVWIWCRYSSYRRCGVLPPPPTWCCNTKVHFCFVFLNYKNWPAISNFSAITITCGKEREWLLYLIKWLYLKLVITLFPLISTCFPVLENCPSDSSVMLKIKSFVGLLSSSGGLEAERADTITSTSFRSLTGKTVFALINEKQIED